MKMVKNIAIVACLGSFMFASIGFHMANNYTDMDDGTQVLTSWGATYALNASTSLGYDSALGMLFYFDVPAGISFRLGWQGGDADTSSIGLGYTWWTGGTGLKTSISTSFDMVSNNTPVDGEENSWNTLSMAVGFGF